MEKEILIALECILKMFRTTDEDFDTFVNQRLKYLESTIKRIEEVIERIENA